MPELPRPVQLVVDAVGISPQSDLLANNDVKVTRNTRIVERIVLKNPQTLQIDTMISDDELLNLTPPPP